MSWVSHCYSELIKVHCRSQSFHAASRAVKFPTTIHAFFFTYSDQNDEQKSAVNINYFLNLIMKTKIGANRRRLVCF